LLKADNRKKSDRSLQTTDKTTNSRLEEMNQLLYLIAQRRKKCRLHIFFDGKTFRCDHIIPNVKADDLR